MSGAPARVAGRAQVAWAIDLLLIQRGEDVFFLTGTDELIQAGRLGVIDRLEPLFPKHQA